ncbi:MAG: RNA-binding protein [Caldithrix sp.]|nr:RNA-binding protein [Caldithrix sp.]
MNIYVGNLDFSLTEEELRQQFESFGEVSSVKIIKDHDSGRSRGFGFIEMPDSDQAKTAMSDLNGKEVNGRALRIDEARPKKNNR